MPSANTVFKVSMVNFYQFTNDYNGDSGANDGAVVPTLIRFGGMFNATDLSSGTKALGLFLDSYHGDY